MIFEMFARVIPIGLHALGTIYRECDVFVACAGNGTVERAHDGLEAPCRNFLQVIAGLHSARDAQIVKTFEQFRLYARRARSRSGIYHQAHWIENAFSVNDELQTATFAEEHNMLAVTWAKDQK